MPIERPNRDALKDYTSQAIEETESQLAEDRAELAEQEAQANMSTLDRVWNWGANTVSDIAGAIADNWRAGQEYLRQQQQYIPDSPEEAMEQQDAIEQGDVSSITAQDDDTDLQQSIQNYQESDWRMAASPFGETAREFVNAYADSDEDGYVRRWARGLQNSEVNFKYFAYDEDKLNTARKVQEMTGISADALLTDSKTWKQGMEVYRYAQDVQKAGGSMENVWQEYPELRDVANMNTNEAAIALHNIESVRSTHSIVEAFTHFQQIGNMQTELGNLRYKIMNGEASENDVARAKDLEQMLQKEKIELPSFWDAPGQVIAGMMAQTMPLLYKSAMEAAGESAAFTEASIGAGAGVGSVVPGVGTAGGAAVGGAVGLTFGAGRFVANVLRAIESGGKVANVARTYGGRLMINGSSVMHMGALGAKFGMFEGMYRPTTGDYYDEYSNLRGKNGIALFTKEEAKKNAILAGLANTTLEMGNYGLITKSFTKAPHASKVFSDIIENTGARMEADEVAKALARDKAKDFFKVAATESGEEALQSISDDLIHNKLAFKAQDENLKYKDASTIATNAAGNFVESLPASLGFGLLSAGGGSIVGGARANRAMRKRAKVEAEYGTSAVKTINGTLMYEQLQNAVKDGKMRETAPDVQQKVLKAQLAGTDFQNVYIDTEMALKKENGLEDLRAAAKAGGYTDEELQTAIDEKGHIMVPGEKFAQAESSSELLDAVSFDEHADSMARMRQSAKETLETVKKIEKESIEKQMSLMDAVVNEYFPKGKASPDQIDMARAAIFRNPANPAQGWTALYKESRQQLDAILAPAMATLNEGMGQGGKLMEVDDEQGNKKTVRFTENAPWYRSFYAAYKRKPNKQELEDMAIAMTIGDESAPKVEGWIPTSEEEKKAMAEVAPEIRRLQNNMESLNSVKDKMKTMTGSEMSMIEGFTKEQFHVYRDLVERLKAHGGITEKAARIDAVIFARHAGLYAKVMSENTGKKYTAQDYYEQRFGLDFTGNPQYTGEAASRFNELAPGIDIDKMVKVLNIKELSPELLGKSNKEVLEYIKTVVDKSSVPTADFKATIGIPENSDPYGQKHILFGKSAVNKSNRNAAKLVVSNLKEIAEHAIVIEVTKNKKDKKLTGLPGAKRKTQNRKNSVDEYYRMMLPVKIKDQIKTLVLVAESRNGKVALDIPETKLYEVYYAKKEHRPAAVANTQEGVAISAVQDGALSKLSIRDMLRGVKDDNGKPYINDDGSGNFADVERYNQMAGVNAYGAAKGSLLRAKSMDAKKQSPDKIFDETGWLKGADGKWRFEIPDNLDNIHWDGLKTKNSRMLWEVYDNEQLYEAYPWLSYYSVQLVEMQAGGRGHIRLGTNSSIEINKKLSNDERAKTLVHEIQHIIQVREGFAQGGSPEHVRDEIQNEIDSINKKINEIKRLEKENNLTGTMNRYVDELKGAIRKLDYALKNNLPVNDVVESAKDKTEKQIESIKQELAQIPYSREYVKANDEFLKALENGMDEELEKASDKVNHYSDQMAPDSIDKIMELSTDLEKLESDMQRYLDYSRYYNLAGEQEARNTADRAVDMTQKAHAKSKMSQSEQNLNNEIAKLTSEQKEEFEEFKKLDDRSDEDLLDEESSRYEKLGNSLPEQLIDAYNEYKWNSFDYEEKSRAIAMPRPHDENAIVVFNGQEMAMAMPPRPTQENLGFTNFYSDGMRIVSILENANASTFVHEMGHVFLDDLETLAQFDETSAKELAIVNEWAEWHKGDAEKYRPTNPKGRSWYKEFSRREQAIIDAEAAGDHDAADRLKREWKQERFARAFELYLRDGQAPAKGLKAVFRKFKSFLKEVYMVFTSDGARASEPVKRIMDRMIATEEEINQAALDDRYKDITKAGGEKLFDESGKKTYERWLDEAEETAKDKLRKVVMKDLEEKRQKEFEDRVAREKEVKRSELENMPVYLAERAVMKTGGDEEIVKIWYNSVDDWKKELEATKPLEEALNEYINNYKDALDEELINAHLTDEEVEKAMEGSEYYEKLEALKATEMAKKQSLIRQINSKSENAMRSIEEKIMALPDDVDIKMDRNSAGVKALMEEINKLRFSNKWAPKDYYKIEAMINAVNKDEVKKALKDFREQAKEYKANEKAVMEANEGKLKMYAALAKESIRNKPIHEACDIGRYRREAKKAAKRVQQMLWAENLDMAMSAQQQKAMFAAEAYEAQKMRDEVEKIVKKVQQQATAKTVKIPQSERYWLKHLAYELGFTQKDAPKPAGYDTITPEEIMNPSYLAKMLMDMQERKEIGDADEYLAVLNMIMRRDEESGQETFNGRKWQQLTYDQLRDVADTLTVLYTVGRDKGKLKMIHGKDFDDVIDEILTDKTGDNTNIHTELHTVRDDRGGLAYSDWLAKVPGIGNKLAETGQEYMASLIRPEEITVALGEKAHKYIYGLYEQAANKEGTMKAKEVADLTKILEPFSHKERREWKKEKIKLVSSTGEEQLLTKEEVICMGLNMGNKTNLQRLMGGMNLQYTDLIAFMEENMTEKDWTLVQNLWTHINSFWDATVAVEEQLNGVSLQKVEATPFSIKTADGKTVELTGGVVEIEGGYYPIAYNTKKSSRSQDQEADSIARSQMSAQQRLGVNQSYKKSRSEVDINRPLLLKFDVINKHITDVIHNICFRVAARDVYRLVTDQRLEEHMNQTIGRAYHNVLKNWAADVWAQEIGGQNEAQHVVDKVFNYMQRNSVMAIMGYQLWPVVENASNIGPVMDKLGAIGGTQAVLEFYANMEKNKELVYKSTFMKNRINNMDRDISQQPGLFNADSKVFETIRNHAYDMMLFSDLALSAPLWVKTYKDCFGDMVKEVKAENEANIKAMEDAQAKVDSIRAQQQEAITTTAEINQHMQIRKHGTPEQIAYERKTSPFAIHSDDELRAMTAENAEIAKNKDRELYDAEHELNKAMELDVLTEDRMLEEAERRAIAKADGAVRDTFGSGETKDLSSVQRQRGVYRLLTTFYSFFNTQFNAIWRQYRHGKYGDKTLSAFQRWAPFAKSMMYRIVIMCVIGSTLKFALGQAGNDDKDKYRTIVDPVTGKETKIEIPAMERFLKVLGSNMVGTMTGGFFVLRDLSTLISNLVFDGTDYGRGVNPFDVAYRSMNEFVKAGKLMAKKGEKDLEIQAQQEKREREWQERLKKLRGKKRQDAIKKHEEDEKYRQPPKRILYSDVARHAANGTSSLTAGYTGITSTMVDSITSTMEYLNDEDMRYDSTWGNIIWSAIWDKKPVEREIPKRPPAPSKPKKSQQRKSSEK